MIYTPSTTKTILTANNTSASSAFLGWPNGDVKAGNVSNVPMDMPQLKLVHRCDWWGGTSHPNIGVNVLDPLYCAATAADMKRRGLDGCTLLWHGATSMEGKSAVMLFPELEKQALKGAIMIGSSTAALKMNDATFTVAQRTAVLNGIFDYLRTTFFHSPAYLRDNGRPIVMFFGVTGVDWNAVRAHIHTFAADEPLFIFRYETNYSFHPQADGCFGWTHCDEGWVTAAKTVYANKLIMLGVNGGFNSSISGPPVNCTWGSGTIITQAGGTRMQSQIALGKAHPELRYAHIPTWNDYQEGSEIETGLNSGATISLALSKNALSWNDPGAAFDHCEVFISDDGERMMPLAIARGVTSVDLAGYGVPYGKWTFYVRGVGKFAVQNIMSNAVKADLDWAVL